MNLFLTNLVIAFVWVAWQGQLTLAGLALGFLGGMALLRLSVPLYRKGEDYFRRSWGFVIFIAVFSREMYNSTLSVAKSVLFERTAKLHPNLLTVDTRGMSPLEILLLTHTITLTPGTTSVDVAPDFSWILVHALDGRKPAAVRQSIEGSLKAAILRFTR